MRNALKTQEEALIYFLELLDIDMIDTLLENDRTYQDMEKQEFIRKLGQKTGICDSVKCHFKCKGHTFTGNYNGWEMDKWNINFQFWDTNKKKDPLHDFEVLQKNCT